MTSGGTTPPPEPAAAVRRVPWADVAVAAGFLLLSWWVFHHLWMDPHGRALELNQADQALDEWFLALGPHVWRGDLDLVTGLLNAPQGVNLLANASLLAYGAVLAPVTVAFGAPVSFVLALTINLAATATGWYLLLARALRLHRVAALAGALLAGFSPGVVSQSNAHVHMAAQFLVPAMAYCLVRIARASRLAGFDGLAGVMTWGAVLGGLVAVQVFLGEEVLFLTAVTMGLFTIGYAAVHRARAAAMARLFVAGIVTTAAVATLLLAYPLQVQFGPARVPGSPFPVDYYHADLATFPAVSPLSLAGSPLDGALSSGAAEYNTYLGWPLLILVAGLAVWLRRRPVVLPAAFAALVMCWISLGPHVYKGGSPADFPALYRLVGHLPLVQAALPSRFALAAPPLFGVILAVGLDAAIRAGGRIRAIAVLAAGLALVPVLPAPLPAAARPDIPRFITGGYWKRCVGPGGVLVPAPPPTPDDPDTMRWAAATRNAFGLPEGFFIGPYAAGGQASMGTYKQPTSALLADVARTGQVPVITAGQRRQAAADLAYWRASCVALVPGPHADQVRSVLDDLIGPGGRLADTWVWRVGAGSGRAPVAGARPAAG